jgi:hypothetical protein
VPSTAEEYDEFPLIVSADLGLISP